MVADGQVGLGQAGLGHGPEHQEGQVVDGVALVRGLAADGDVLIHGAAGAGEGVGLGAHLVDGEGLYPQAGQQLQGIVAGDAAAVDVGPVVGVHVLVKAAVGQAVAVGLDLEYQLDEPYGLHRLPEGPGGLIGHAGAGVGQLQQLGAAGGVGRGVRQLLRQGGVAQGEAADGVDDDEHRFVEHVFVDGIGVGQIQGSLGLAGAALVAGQALGQYAAVVHRQVGVAGVELALHAENAGLHEHADLVGQQGAAAGAKVVVLPEGGNGAELALGVLGDVEHVAVALFKCVQLVHDELQGVLGEDGGIAVLGSLVARQQGLVLDVDGHFVQDVLQHQRALHDAGLVAVRLVGLCGQNGALRVDVGFLVQDLLAEGLHAGRQCAEVLGVFHSRLLICFKRNVYLFLSL